MLVIVRCPNAIELMTENIVTYCNNVIKMIQLFNSGVD